jgi:hypothetical protein
MKNSLGFFFFLIFVSACNNPSQIKQSEELKEEMASRELRKIPEVEILTQALKFGDSIAAVAQKTLAANLMKAIKTNGISFAIAFCNTQAYPIIDSISKDFNTEVRRVSLKTRNSSHQPNEIETEILQAYHYNQENQLKMESSIQEINEEQILFTKPIKIENTLCLNCHGRKGDEIPAEVEQKINELYPKDQAHGYQVGDLRGMWSILIPRNQIVKML